MPLLRIIKTEGEVLVIICDKDLLGKEFRQGEFRLHVSESFYMGEEASIERCISALNEATIANLVGSIVEDAIKAGIIDPQCVMRIQNVPHAQLVRI
ncbi:MAG: hypothetical protein APU95_01630 [Hadesarchaea archaeon YNP_N21]|jgi:hypothetical protein|nr:MAG: hypothetical protein APU95_01630 [Hadesarchaea archaeon YNP_N21]